MYKKTVPLCTVKLQILNIFRMYKKQLEKVKLYYTVPFPLHFRIQCVCVCVCVCFIQSILSQNDPNANNLITINASLGCFS